MFFQIIFISFFYFSSMTNSVNSQEICPKNCSFPNTTLIPEGPVFVYQPNCLLIHDPKVLTGIEENGVLKYTPKSDVTSLNIDQYGDGLLDLPQTVLRSKKVKHFLIPLVVIRRGEVTILLNNDQIKMILR